MNMDRRDFIRGIGKALCIGAAVPFIPSLIPDVLGLNDWVGQRVDASGILPADLDIVALLKEFYRDDILMSWEGSLNYTFQIISKPKIYDGREITLPFMVSKKNLTL